MIDIHDAIERCRDAKTILIRYQNGVSMSESSARQTKSQLNVLQEEVRALVEEFRKVTGRP